MASPFDDMRSHFGWSAASQHLGGQFSQTPCFGVLFLGEGQVQRDATAMDWHKSNITATKSVTPFSLAADEPGFIPCLHSV